MTSAMKVHNADLFVEVMQSADWSPSTNVIQASDAQVKLRDMQQQLASQSSPHRARPGAGRGVSPVKLPGTTDAEYAAMSVQQRLQATERALRQREAFIEKQRSRENEVRQRLDQSMRATQRAASDRAIARERDFEARSAKFAVENSEIIRELAGIVREDDIWRQRRKERLYQEWTDNVFNAVQDHISETINSMSHLDVASRRREMFQAFLDESNRKKGGLFRDIIIESDYDPLADQRSAAVKYKPVSHAEDPCKNRFTRENADGETRTLLKTMNTLSNGALTGSGAPQSTGMMSRSIAREVALPVTMWDKIDVTPFGRYGDEPLTTVTKPSFNKSTVKVDHYNVPSGAEGRKLLIEEQNHKGKKTFPKLSESNVF
jgi:hypothetical protein